MTRQLESVESRVDDIYQMNDLYGLTNAVFSLRSKGFHWNLSTIVEENCTIATVPLSGLDPEVEAHSTKADGYNDQVNTIMQEMLLQTKVTYDISSFVAVRLERHIGLASVWIGKVLGTTNDKKGKVKSIWVHWYATHREDTWMNGKYYPCVRHEKKKDGRAEPWTDELCFDTVIVSFRALKIKLLLTSNCAKIASS